MTSGLFQPSQDFRHFGIASGASVRSGGLQPLLVAAAAMAGGHQADHRHSRRRARRGAYRMVLDAEAGRRRQAQTLHQVKIDDWMRLAPRVWSGAGDILSNKDAATEAAT